ncbi:MAG TPA: SDR family oxidoreductase [Rhodocyclaceae bacterium]|nr:SDR family oxidoreductase [Rhodocyclaceae bacterium]
MNNPFDLSGKVALVTGASRGIGAALATGLAQAGASIMNISLDDQLAETTASFDAATKQGGGKHAFIQANLSSVPACYKAVDDTVAKFGKLDILVNCAGMIRRAPFVEHSEADFDIVMNINLKAPVFLSQAFVKHVLGRSGKGKIVNICSLLSFQGGILVPGYTASKHGIAGITKLIANELGAKGINCNGIAPGYVSTENTAQIRADEKRYNSILDRIPAGRWSEPADLAGTCVFLASSASDYVNGAVLNVDGGWLAR